PLITLARQGNPLVLCHQGVRLCTTMVKALHEKNHRAEGVIVSPRCWPTHCGCVVHQEDEPEMGGLTNDLRYAMRQLRKNPGFTSVAIITLALGIGATTAIFSVVYGVLLRPLPYSDPNRIMAIFEVTTRGTWNRLADPNFDD